MKEKGKINREKKASEKKKKNENRTTGCYFSDDSWTSFEMQSVTILTNPFSLPGVKTNREEFPDNL